MRKVYLHGKKLNLVAVGLEPYAFEGPDALNQRLRLLG